MNEQNKQIQKQNRGLPGGGVVRGLDAKGRGTKKYK